MGSIERRSRNGSVRWLARYRTPDGIQRSKTFCRKAEAERFILAVEVDKLRGSFVDPKSAQILVATWAEDWLASQTDLSTSTRERYAGILRTYIVRAWGRRPLGTITHREVQAWVAALAKDRSPATVHKIHRVLSCSCPTPWRMAGSPGTWLRVSASLEYTKPRNDS